jgi:hypothetical protein
MADAASTLPQLAVKDNCKSSGVTGMDPQIAVSCRSSSRCVASFTWCVAATDSESALPDPELPGDSDPISPHAHAVPPRFPPVNPLCRAISSPSLIR